MINVTHFKHAYRQAPWRIHRQWAGVFLLSLMTLTMISALYLDVTANAGIAGREIQRLRIQITTTQRMNADLETQLATLLSTSRMEQRARELGFRPAAAGEIQYLVVPGFVRPAGVSLAKTKPQAVLQSDIPPEYTLSLLDWITELLRDPAQGIAEGVLP